MSELYLWEVDYDILMAPDAVNPGLARVRRTDRRRDQHFVAGSSVEDLVEAVHDAADLGCSYDDGEGAIYHVEAAVTIRAVRLHLVDHIVPFVREE